MPITSGYRKLSYNSPSALFVFPRRSDTIVVPFYRKMPQTTEIRLHNTLSNQTEPFVPLKPGEVTMYTCGPTVYDYAHIGNYRTFVFQDILRRFLKLRGFRLNHVMNLTDVDDRIIANAAAQHVSIRDYTEKFAQ